MASTVTSRGKTDWSKCCLCQEDKKNEGLTSPSASVHQNPEHDGYVMIAVNVQLFKEIGETLQHYVKTWQNTTRAVESFLTMQNLIVQGSEDLKLKVANHKK